MSYCVKHAENFHTQTCCRCNDESAIAAKDAEIAALRQEIATGRGQYHRDYAAECDSLLAAKDKVIADLRERCERLAKLVETKRAPTLARDGEEKFGAWLRAALDCATHNDLAPAAGEPSNGGNDAC